MDVKSVYFIKRVFNGFYFLKFVILWLANISNSTKPMKLLNKNNDFLSDDSSSDYDEEPCITLKRCHALYDSNFTSDFFLLNIQPTYVHRTNHVCIIRYV